MAFSYWDKKRKERQRKEEARVALEARRRAQASTGPNMNEYDDLLAPIIIGASVAASYDSDSGYRDYGSSSSSSSYDSGSSSSSSYDYGSSSSSYDSGSSYSSGSYDSGSSSW